MEKGLWRWRSGYFGAAGEVGLIRDNQTDNQGTAALCGEGETRK